MSLDFLNSKQSNKENSQRYRHPIHATHDIREQNSLRHTRNEQKPEKALEGNRSFDSSRESVNETLKNRLSNIKQRLESGNLTQIDQSFTLNDKTNPDITNNEMEDTPFKQKYLTKNNETTNDSIIQNLLFGIDGLESTSSRKKHQFPEPASKRRHKEVLDSELKTIEKKMSDLFELEKKKLIHAQHELAQGNNRVNGHLKSAKKNQNLENDNSDLSEPLNFAQRTGDFKMRDENLLDGLSGVKNKLDRENKEIFNAYEAARGPSSKGSIIKGYEFSKKKSVGPRVETPQKENQLNNSNQVASNLKHTSPKKKNKDSDYVAQITNYKVENDRLSERVSGLEYENRTLHNKLDNLEKAVQGLTELEKERHSMLISNSRDTPSKGYYLSISQREKDPEKRQSKQNESISFLNNYNSHSISGIDPMTSKENESEIKTLKNQISRLCEELDGLHKRNTELSGRSELENKGKHFAQETSYRQDFNAQIEQKDREIMLWKEKCQILQTKYLKAFTKIRDENKKLRQEVSMTYYKLTGEISDVLKQIDQSNKKSSRPKARAASASQPKKLKLVKK